MSDYFVRIVLIEKIGNIAISKCQAASSDGECIHKQCPQLNDDEPRRSGRSCPLICKEDEEYW